MLIQVIKAAQVVIQVSHKLHCSFETNWLTKLMDMSYTDWLYLSTVYIFACFSFVDEEFANMFNFVCYKIKAHSETQNSVAVSGYSCLAC